MILKMLLSFSLATISGVVCSFLYFIATYFLIHVMKYNYGKENYWVFSHMFICFILTWILSYGYLMATIKDQ